MNNAAAGRDKEKRDVSCLNGVAHRVFLFDWDFYVLAQRIF
jgi:hypothetical protein